MRAGHFRFSFFVFMFARRAPRAGRSALRVLHARTVRGNIVRAPRSCVHLASNRAAAEPTLRASNRPRRASARRSPASATTR
ncbi:secretion protein HylD [Burkholderia sp. 117]|nr:secretion protein HylD [Burkholderia sp. 136(2017)]PNX16644.1 secretion protein HylD [Burkholderia sp. 129]PNX27220.1 secretion protein HylD [Burkholderia sp. 117]PNX35857.1 secretion protein HylD [Burkholderia sp. 137]